MTAAAYSTPIGLSVEDLVDSLLGGVIYRLLTLRETVTAEDVERLVDAILAPSASEAWPAHPHPTGDVCAA